MSQEMAKVHLSNSALTSWAGDEYSSILLEQIATMVKKEDAFYSCVDYIGELPELDNDSIDGEWRQMAAEWMFRVIDFYDLDREIVNVAMAYLDRLFTTSSLHHRWDKKQCGIVPIASLKLAIKLLEPRTMNMDDMIKLGMRLGVTISSHAVVEMELEILWKLKWNIFPPSAFCFAHHMISLFPREVPKSPTRYIMQELTKYMTELAVCVYDFVKFKVSSKSFASCLVAMDSLDDDCIITPEAKVIFLTRIYDSFGLRHDDEEILTLTGELQALLCHNTDLMEFVALIRASNKPDQSDDSPKSAAVKRYSSDKSS